MSRRMVDQFAEDTMGTVTPIRPGKQLSMHPEAVKSRARRAVKKAVKKHAAKASKKPVSGPPAAPEATLPQPLAGTPAAPVEPVPQPQSGQHPALLEHVGVAVLSALVVALMVKVAYGSFATIVGTSAYLASAEQAANLAWSIVGAEILLGLFLGLAHKVVRFRRLAKPLALMLLACIAVEASMAWVRTEASIHKAVDAALQPSPSSHQREVEPSVTVSTQGRSRGAIRDMTGLATAAASLAQTQAADQERKDAREDRRAAERIASAKDRSQLAQWIPVGAAVVQAGATELGGLAVAELVWALLAIAAGLASRRAQS